MISIFTPTRQWSVSKTSCMMSSSSVCTTFHGRCAGTVVFPMLDSQALIRLDTHRHTDTQTHTALCLLLLKLCRHSQTHTDAHRRTQTHTDAQKCFRSEERRVGR